MKRNILTVPALILVSAACLCTGVMASETGHVRADVLNVRKSASVDSAVIGTLKNGAAVEIVKEADDDWYQISYAGSTGYVSSQYIVTDASPDDKTAVKTGSASDPEEEKAADNGWDGPVLNSINGTIMGPSGKETYYNLDMSGIIEIMRSMGNQDEYWVRSDGCKMLGDYIMCAANLDVHPRGSLVESSLGTCIVCDTGGFAAYNPNQLDIAVTW